MMDGSTTERITSPQAASVRDPALESKKDYLGVLSGKRSQRELEMRLSG